jgi:hypothetical protein
MKQRLLGAVLAAGLVISACSPTAAGDNSGYRPIRTATPLTANMTVSIPPQPTGVLPVAEEQTDGNAPGIPPLTGEIQTTSSGLRYIEEFPGTGASPQAGQTVNVHYTGWLTNGQKFDSSVDRGQPFSFPIGQSRVIRGWDEGVAAMQVGGKRRLIIPSTLGYGTQGAGGVIPPNATLIFDVELLSVDG